jgi:Uma2 family endonuclease
MIVTSPIKTETTYYTPEEYLNLEEKSTEKHEYHDGEIIKMTGGTTNHNTLAGKIYARLLLKLEDQNYQIYIGDVRLWIEKYRRYTYPDVMIVKGEPIYHGKGKTTIINPSLIVEVLSKSTKDYDQNDKFDSYRTIPDFQEYILIDQYQYYVKQFAKNEQGKWVLTDYFGENSELKLESIDFTITLKELYKKVDFQEEVESVN